MEGLKTLSETFTEAENEIFMKGVRFQQYWGGFQAHIRVAREEGESLKFYAIVEKEFVLDLLELLGKVYPEIAVGVEIPERTGALSDPENYRVMGLSQTATGQF